MRIKCNWLEGWFYRIPILINNTNSTNLQNVEVNLDTSTLISNAKLRRDCSDIRFTDSDGISLLNYNIRNCNSENTKIWINITIPASSNKTIYLYYGNPNANFPTYYNITPAPPISISIIFPKAWLSGFQYRKSILINNTQNSNNLNDYQILITNPIYNENGLILSYHFNEGSGTIAYDSSGNNNNGNLINGPAWVDGKFGKALQFDGVNDYVISSKGISPPSTFTANIWIYYTGDNGVVVDWLGQNAINTGYHDSGIEIVNGRVKIRYWNLQCVDLGSITPNNWYMITIVYDGNNLKGYINGELKGSTSGSLSHPSSLYIALGATDSTNCGDGTYFAGKVDEFKFYNRALSDDEIKALYQAKARLDYEDVRFTDSDEITLLNYWQEADGKFWVKVNISANSIKTIYLYYGNPSASSLSNPDNTFIFYDDFLGTSLNTSKWTVLGSSGATTSVSNGIFRITISSTSGGYYQIRSNTAIPFGVIIEARVNAGGTSGCRGLMPAYSKGTGVIRYDTGVSYGSYYAGAYLSNGADNYSGWSFGVRTEDGSSTLATKSNFYTGGFNVWLKNRLIVTQSYQQAFIYDDNWNLLASSSSSTNTLPSATYYVDLGNMWYSAGSTYSFQYDWVRVRKYTSPEPISSLGAEQSLSNFVEENYYS